MTTLNKDELGNEETVLGISLMDLADVNLDDIPEVTYEALPVGVYLFEGSEVGIKSVDTQNDEGVPVLDVKLTVVEAQEILNLPEGKTLEDYIDKSHRESFFFKDQEGLGRFRTFVKQVGLHNGGEMLKVVNSLVGHRFIARVIHSKNKNDPERPFVNLRPEPVKSTDE